MDVDPGLVGARCSAGSVQTEEGGSEHPNNDYLLSSAGTTAEILDFEAVSGAEQGHGAGKLPGCREGGNRCAHDMRIA